MDGIESVIVESEVDVSERKSQRSEARRSARMEPVPRKISRRVQAIRDESASERRGGESRRMVFRAARGTAEFLDCVRAHYRETRRKEVDIPAEIKIVLDDGTVFDSGTARVRNVSPSGALLAEVKLSGNCYPARSFKVALLMKGGEFEGIGFEAIPVRFVPEQNGLGVKFDDVFVNLD